MVQLYGEVLLVLEIVIRIGIACILGRAAISKLMVPGELNDALQQMRISSRNRIPIARLVGGVELACALVAILGPGSVVAVLVGGLFLAFAGIAVYLFKNEVDCGCGGRIFKSGRNAAQVAASRILIALAVQILWLHPEFPAPGTVIWVAIGVASSFLITTVRQRHLSGVVMANMGSGMVRVHGPVAQGERLRDTTVARPGHGGWRDLDFPRWTAVGRVGVLKLDSDLHLVDGVVALGRVRVPDGRVALDITPGIQPELATRHLEGDDLEYLRAKYLFDRSGRFLERLTHLERLVLGTNATDQITPVLRSLSSLRDLVLVGEELTDYGLRQLRGNNSLTNLLVSSPSISNEGVLDLISGLPDLESITVDGGELLNDSLPGELANVRSERLRSITFRYCPWMSESAVAELGESGADVSLRTDMFKDNPGLLFQEAPWALRVPV